MLDIEDLEATDFDYKSKLYQLSQREGWAVEFRTRNETQRQRRSYFQIELLVNNEVVGGGEGYSKKEAEQLASMKALALLESRTEVRD